jgi:hypothetical protein
MNPWTRIRISLFALFVLQLLVAIGLVWWRAPFTITQRYAEGGYRQTVVRRDWNGSLHFHGRTTRFYSNGRKQFEYLHYNDRYKSHCVNDLLMPDLRWWDNNGNEVPIENVFERRGLKGYLPLRDDYESLYAKPAS